jgi:acetyl-CoA carboxylase biotin carboxyl carrier protein
MNLKELKELIELITEKGFTEFEIERQGFRMRISRFGTHQLVLQQPVDSIPGSPPDAAAAPASRPNETVPGSVKSSTPAKPSEPEEQLHTIKSIMVGTFYRAPSPTSEPFIRIGDHVEPDTVVCIIEAMKLMNPIQAEVTGEVVKIFAENGQPVEYGQPLFGVRTR